MAEELLKMVNITKRFAGITALDHVSFSCNKGEVHILAGENGAGKSTLLKILAGIYEADEGDIFFRGEKVNIHSPEQAQKLGIAMVFQELTLVRELAVWENIYLNQEPVNCMGIVNKKKIIEDIHSAMNQYGIHVDPYAIVGDLTVAEQQMVEILKILVRRPELIILDEPTSALAKREVEQLYQIVQNLLTAGKTVIFISHRLEELFKFGHRITVFKDGTYIGTVEMKDLDGDALIKMMVGRALNNIFPPPVCEVDQAQVIFEVRNLKDRNHKVNGISFQVYHGEILGIAGLQGHGQTELLNAISGLHQLEGGEVLIAGKRAQIKNAAQAVQSGISLVPADRKNQGLMLDLSIRHNLSIASLKKRLRGCFIDMKAEKKFGESTAHRLSIKMGGLNLQVSSLSGGNQQKVVLGKELATEPRVILFDEPTRGIDVEAKREFYQIMHSLAASGVAVVMNSSDMMEVIGMSSRVLVMYEGKISGVLEKENLTEEKIMQLSMGIDKRKERGSVNV
ncbi:MAG: sugar ABC transporter ATP-binding protein [Stomatobaculum sp.]